VNGNQWPVTGHAHKPCELNIQFAGELNDKKEGRPRPPFPFWVF